MRPVSCALLLIVAWISTTTANGQPYRAGITRLTVGGVAVRGRQRGLPVGAVPDVDKTTHQYAWAEACRTTGIDVDAVHAVICEGFSCKTVDRARARRKGWASEQVRRGLDQWHPARPKRPCQTTRPVVVNNSCAA